MYRLEHRGVLALRIEIGTGRQAHTARNGRAEVRQDVAKEVARDDDLKALRVLDEHHARRIDEQLLRLDVRVLLADLGENLIPEHHRVAERIALGDGRQRLVLAARRLIGIAHDALAALAREDTRLQCDLLRRARIEARADVCILALTVLADDNHVDVLALDAGKRARSALEKLDRAQVDVLVKAAADLQQQLPE